MKNLSKIIIYTDGSALNNGSSTAKCGWAYKLIYEDGSEDTKIGREFGMTNNQMEIMAIIKAMQGVADKDAEVHVYTDSNYVVGIVNEENNAHANLDLWKMFFKEKRKFKNISFYWVRGHDKNKHNNDVDLLAAAAANGLMDESGVKNISHD